MRLYRNLIFVILLFILLISAAYGDEPKQLKDFNIFRTILFEKEGKIDLHTSKDRINEYLDLLELNLKKSSSILEQFKLYSSTLAKIQCGHTQIHPNKNVLREWLRDRNSLPIDYYLIGKKLVVSKTLDVDLPLIQQGKSAREQKKYLPPSSEILTIDGFTVPEMMERIGEFLSSDENSTDFKYYQASQLFEFYRHLSLPFSRDSIRIDYVYQSDTNVIYFNPGTAPVHTMNARLNASSTEFHDIEMNHGNFKLLNKSIGYFRFQSFNACYGIKYEAFLKQSFEKIKNRNINKLVFDLRGNTGGVMQYSLMRYLVGEGVFLGSYVVEKPKSGFESKYIKKFNIGYIKYSRMSRSQKRIDRKGDFDNGRIYTEQIDSSLLYNGEILVITDEGTFSSAAMFACHLKTLSNAKIMGSPAGGSFYTGNSGSLQVLLPYSKFKMYVNPNTYTSHLNPSVRPTDIKNPDIALISPIVDCQKRDEYFMKQAVIYFE